MHQILDQRLEYLGYGGCRCHCRVQAWRQPWEPDVVMVTECDDNPGTSITGAAALLATEVYRKLGCPTNGMIWIECYPENVHGLEGPEHWTLVLLAWDGQAFYRPEWIYLKQEQVEHLIGETLPREAAPV